MLSIFRRIARCRACNEPTTYSVMVPQVSTKVDTRYPPRALNLGPDLIVPACDRACFMAFASRTDSYICEACGDWFAISALTGQRVPVTVFLKRICGCEAPVARRSKTEVAGISSVRWN